MDFLSCKYGNWTVIWSLLSMTDVLAAHIGKRDCNTVTAPIYEWASTERQRFLFLWVWYFNRDLVAVRHNRRIGSIHRATEIATRSLPNSEKECHWSVIDFWSCKYGNWTVIWSLLAKPDILAAFTGKRDSNMVTAPLWEWASTERQRFLVLWVR